jgi:transcription elongation factor Elf1
MSQKDIQQELATAATKPQENESVSRKEPPVFYRCKCPECGEHNLELCGLDVFFRSEFLGVRSDGQFGCGYMELDGEYHWIIRCGSCEHEFFNTNELSDEVLINWAAANGQVMRPWEFTCPVCGSNYLDEVYTMNRSVRAVYETSDNEGAEISAEVALSYEQATEYGKPVRYRCSNDHELTTEDGNPVQSEEELVQWLKAHQPTAEK